MYLIDTNCLSEFRRIASGRADHNVAAWAACVSLSTLYLSVISIFEVQAGISSVESRDPAKAKSLTHWLEEGVIPRFERRILPVDQAIARAAGGFAKVRRIETGDVLIAATALVHDMTIVTRNTSDSNRLVSAF